METECENDQQVQIILSEFFPLYFKIFNIPCMPLEKYGGKHLAYKIFHIAHIFTCKLCICWLLLISIHPQPPSRYMIIAPWWSSSRL